MREELAAFFQNSKSVYEIDSLGSKILKWVQFHNVVKCNYALLFDYALLYISFIFIIHIHIHSFVFLIG